MRSITLLICLLFVINSASAKTIRADVVFEDGMTCTNCKLKFNPKGQVGDHFDIISVKDKNGNELYHGQRLQFQQRPGYWRRALYGAATGAAIGNQIQQQQNQQQYRPTTTNCQSYAWGSTTCQSY